MTATVTRWTKSRKRRLTAVAICLSFPAAIAACGSSDEEVAGASKAVTWYTAVPDEGAREFADAFTAKTGIKVNVVRAAAGDLIQRFSAESEAGSHNADVLSFTATGFYKDAEKKGWVTPLDQAELTNFPGSFPKAFIRENGGDAIPIVLPMGIAYNTDLVSAEEAPREFSDLLDPKWKGRILLTDPTSSPSYPALWSAISQLLGPEFLPTLGDQELKLTASGSPGIEALASGEGEIAVPQTEAAVTTTAAAGAPVAFVTPTSTTGAEFEVLLAANAPHLEAARSFVEFQLSEEGSLAYAEAADAVSAYSPDLPTNYRPLDLSAVAHPEPVYQALGVD